MPPLVETWLFPYFSRFRYQCNTFDAAIWCVVLPAIQIKYEEAFKRLQKIRGIWICQHFQLPCTHDARVLGVHEAIEYFSFRSFKSNIRKHLNDYRTYQGVESVNIFNFHVPVYLESMKPSSIAAGFKRSGLFPFTATNIEWSKLEGKIKQEEAFHSDESVIVKGKWLAR